MDPYDPTKPLRSRPDYGECHGPAEDQPSYCPALPRGYDVKQEEDEDDAMDKKATYDKLVKLGTRKPELRKHIKPVLDSLRGRRVQQRKAQSEIPSRFHKKLDDLDRAYSHMTSAAKDIQRGIAQLDGPARELALETFSDQMEGFVEEAEGWIKWVRRNS